MRLLYSIIVVLFIFGCNSETPKTNSSIAKTIVKDTTIAEDIVEEQIIDYFTLPFFKEEIEEESFELFYKNLIKACLNKDTTTVLNSIHDTLRFSKYECAYGMFINAGCENCVRCSKKGMLEGIFAGSNNIEICNRLYEMITLFGVGKMSNNKLYHDWLKLENAYLNFNFKDWELGGKYFDYKTIIPLKENIPIKQAPSFDSETIDVLRFRIYEYPNDPGMGEYDEEGKFFWLKINDGYISGKDVLSGFDFTIVIFEPTSSGWKITGFIQPPGC